MARKSYSKKGTNTSIKGKRLEIYVEQLFKDLGKRFVKRNVYYNFRSVFWGSVVRKAQVDVQYYDRYGKTLVECKYYDACRVSAEDITSFRRDIDLIKPSSALVITNSSLTREAEKLAGSFGIEVYDNEALRMLDNERRGIAMNKNTGRRAKTLEQQLREISLSKYDFEKHYSITRYVLI